MLTIIDIINFIKLDGETKWVKTSVQLYAYAYTCSYIAIASYLPVGIAIAN